MSIENIKLPFFTKGGRERRSWYWTEGDSEMAELSRRKSMTNLGLPLFHTTNHGGMRGVSFLRNGVRMPELRQRCSSAFAQDRSLGLLQKWVLRRGVRSIMD